MSARLAEPNACRWCSVGERRHNRRWCTVPEIGWHHWTVPTDAQRKTRMLARRAATGRPVQDQADQPIHTGADMPKPARDRINAAAEHLRALARQSAPGNWDREQGDDGAIVFRTVDDTTITIAGPAAQGLAAYIDALHHFTGVGVAELLWQIGHGMDPTSTAASIADQLLRRPRE